MDFILPLKERNELLFWFGMFNLFLAIVFGFLVFIKPTEIAGTNGWYKPIKFALSIGILSLTIAWYTGYLFPTTDIKVASWVIAVSLAFEIIYIGWQAARGEQSHFNQSTPFYSFMYGLMAIGASMATFAVAYVGIKFFSPLPQELPNYYLWAIRLGFILFVVFSFEGFAMGARLSHGVGGLDGGPGIPFLNWSVSHGDLRIAHFIGMHAIQVLPILSFYLFKNTKLTIAFAVLYALLASFVLIQALNGKTPLNRERKEVSN